MMTELHFPFPDEALALIQPWAWAVIYGGKDVENRSRPAFKHLKRRGRFAIHASSGMTRKEYIDARDYMRSIGVECPPAAALVRGGIIGSVEIFDHMTGNRTHNKWFFGPVGLLLRNPVPCEPIPVVGALGFFRWSRASDSAIQKPKPWMLPKTAVQVDPKRGDNYVMPFLLGDK